MFLAEDWLQETRLDYVEKQVCIEFYNEEMHEFFYALVAKRGNLQYAMKKGAVCDEISETVSDIVFDGPVPGFRNLGRTRFLFVTLTFDPRKFTAEEAWASLKSTRSKGMDSLYNVINGFAANISKIFGTNGKLVSKEAQANGYPAPHLLIVLDEPVLVRRKKVKGDIVSGTSTAPCSLNALGRTGVQEAGQVRLHGGDSLQPRLEARILRHRGRGLRSEVQRQEERLCLLVQVHVQAPHQGPLPLHLIPEDDKGMQGPQPPYGPSHPHVQQVLQEQGHRKDSRRRSSCYAISRRRRTERNRLGPISAWSMILSS